MVRSSKDGKWMKLRAGDYVMHTWSGSDQLTYRASRESGGWVLKRSVAGAASKSGIIIAEDLHRLRDAVAAAASDVRTALA